jgi:Mn-dependent DtxR family transcriptional regulator
MFCAYFLVEGFSWKGVHIMLCRVEHILGRMVKEKLCHIDGPNVSGINCTITR